MKLHRVVAVMLRYFLLYPTSFGRLLDIFYWPMRDIIMWGLTSVWAFKTQPDNDKLLFSMLAGVVLWQVVLRSNTSTGLSVFEDIVSQNLLNMVSTPVTLSEWIAGIMGMSGILAFSALVFSIVIAKILYGINIFSVGIVLLPLIIILLLFGWSLGFFGASCVLYGGTKGLSFIYIISWSFAPFVGIFYPLSVLPSWCVIVSKGIPASYVFEQLRSISLNGTYVREQLLVAFALSCVYLIIALAIFVLVFKHSKARGVAQLQ